MRLLITEGIENINIIIKGNENKRISRNKYNNEKEYVRKNKPKSTKKNVLLINILVRRMKDKEQTINILTRRSYEKRLSINKRVKKNVIE